MQKTKWARDQLRGMVSPEELDATTKRAYELERAVEQARKGRK
ncbi:hypothetical protein [Streptomyces sp.]|nr:hypothetical protein [Streptomyces sp.]